MVNINIVFGISAAILIVSIVLSLLCKTDMAIVTIGLPLTICLLLFACYECTHHSPSWELHYADYALVKTNDNYIYAVDQNKIGFEYYDQGVIKEGKALRTDYILESTESIPYVRIKEIKYIWWIFYTATQTYQIFIT